MTFSVHRLYDFMNLIYFYICGQRVNWIFFTNVGVQVVKYEYMSAMIFDFKKNKEALFLPYTYENTLC